MSDLKAAAEALILRSLQITAACNLSEAETEKIFSPKNIHLTTNLCLAFMEAVANIPSAAALCKYQGLFNEMESSIMTANAALAQRTHEDLRIIKSICSSEKTLFHLLRKGDALILIFAVGGQKFKSVVRTILNTIFTQIHYQLTFNRSPQPDCIKKALRLYMNPLASLVAEKIKPILAESGEKLEASLAHEMKTLSRDLRRSYRNATDSIISITGPRTDGKCQQIEAAVVFAAKQKRPMKLHDICLKSFFETAGGYKSAHSVESWCRDNEDRFWRYVNEVRLELKSE